jgi:hypothetical protein
VSWKVFYIDIPKESKGILLDRHFIKSKGIIVLQSLSILLIISSTSISLAQNIPNYETGQYAESNIGVINYSFFSERFSSEQLLEMEEFITSQVQLFAITPVSNGFLDITIPDGMWGEEGTGGTPPTLIFVTDSMEDALNWFDAEEYSRTEFADGYLGVPVFAQDTILFGVGPGWEFEDDKMEHMVVLADSGIVTYSWTPTSGGGADTSLKVTGVDAPSSVNAGEEFVVTVSVEYSLPGESVISIDIADPSTRTRIDDNQYTVGGTSTGSSEFTLTAPDSSGTLVLEAQVWLSSGGTWVHDDSGWSSPISIEVKKSIPGFPVLSLLIGTTAGVLLLWLNKR